MSAALLTPAQAANVLHNLRRLKTGFGITTLEGFCADLVGTEAADRLTLILSQLANGTDVHVTLLNSDHAPVLGMLHRLMPVGVNVISHQKVTFYSIDREKLFEQIRTLWNVPFSWTTQLIVRQPVQQVGYDAYLRSARWKLTREAALRRDKHNCVRCGKSEKLQVHHTTYARLGDEALEDLITLCPNCHHLEHPGKAFGAVMREVVRG